MRQKDKKSLISIMVTGLLLLLLYVLNQMVALPLVWQALLYALPYLLVGHGVLLKAGRKILKGQIFSEHLLMSLATLGAFALSFMTGQPEFAEAVFVMAFYQVGELFEHLAEGSSERSIAALLDLRPEQAHLAKDNQTLDLSPSELKQGDVIEIRPGEKVPVDGLLLEGVTQIDTAALTGENLPKKVEVGDQVLSGTINQTGLIRVKVTRELAESTLTKILDLMENSASHKSKSESFMTKFANFYTPLVVLAALLLSLIPPILSGNFVATFSDWLSRGLTFLVISCPCALVISIPLSFFGGLGAASRAGVLIKGSNYLENLAHLETLLFDKTGTLTQGVFEVIALHPMRVDEKRLLHLASHVERFSSHPIALSLRRAYKKEADDCTISDLVEVAGRGIKAKVNQEVVAVGNERFMTDLGISWEPCQKIGTIVHIAIDGLYVGHIVISDRIKPDTKTALEEFKQEGITQTVMVTGDKESVAKAVAQDLGLSSHHAGLLPADKVACLEGYLAQKSSKHTVGFVGDGVNDAPVLARADVGIAMGGLGSDAAIEAADVVIMNDQLTKLAQAIRIAKRTVMIARENAIFSIAIKILVLLLASLGLANMWLAIFADVGVTVLAVFNAMRTLRLS